MISQKPGTLSISLYDSAICALHTEATLSGAYRLASGSVYLFVNCLLLSKVSLSNTFCSKGYFPDVTIAIADKLLSVHLPGLPSIPLPLSLYHVFKASFANSLQSYVYFKTNLFLLFLF